MADTEIDNNDATSEESSEIALVEKPVEEEEGEEEEDGEEEEEEEEYTETNLALGLTSEEVEELALRWGKNDVVVEEDPWWVKLGSKYLGSVPLIMLLVALLSASIVTQW